MLAVLLGAGMLLTETLPVFGTENTSEKVEKIRELLEEDEKTQGGVTRISDMDLAVRILGNGAQHMEDLFAQIRKIIDI